MATYRRARSTARRPRSKYLWLSSDIGAPVTLSQNQVSSTELFTAMPVTMKGASTLVRLVGMWSMFPNSSDLILEGLCCVRLINETALAAADFPDPETDFPRWILRERASMMTGNLLDTGPQDRTQYFDLKGQHRFRSLEERIHLLFKNVSNVASSIHFLYGLRGLFRLH